MSQENVEIVRRVYEVWNAGDMDAIRELYDPGGIIVRSLEGWPEPGPIVGRDAVMRTFGQLRETWDSDTLELISVTDLGDRVLARHTWHTVGHGPGMAMEQTVLFTLRKGRVFLLEYFWKYSEALEALGLSEQATPQQNVELVKKLLPPAGTDYKAVFGDDIAWLAAKELFGLHVASDVEGAFISWGQRQAEFRGLDGLREAWLDWLAPWTRYYDEIEEVFAVGDDRVVLLGREHGYRPDTGAEVAAESAGVYFLRDGKVVRIEYYAKRAEALEAVGLSEQACGG